MLTTEQLAKAFSVSPNTIRASLCRNGHWCGVRPIKLPNRFLAWPDNAVEQVIAASQTNTDSQKV